MQTSAGILPFNPSADVEVLLNALLDKYERRASIPNYAAPAGEDKSGGGRSRRAIRCSLGDAALPGYFSQVDPEPRLVANQQLQALEQAGLLRLEWQAGERGHLLEVVILPPDEALPIFRLVGRRPISGQREGLAELLLGERFRFEKRPEITEDWRRGAIQAILAQLRTGKSPAPFSLADEVFNQDLLAALAALEEVREETPYRVFSVRVFNDSKRFETLKHPLARLARLGQPDWRRLSVEEVLRELNLVNNPGYLYLSGPWQLVDDSGQVLSLGEFRPSVGVPAAQAARVRRASVHSPAIICIENPTAFYEFIRRPPDQTFRSPPAVICLWGNPSPACRHLLGCLVDGLPEHVPLLVWADLDYGGLNILSQLRRQVSPRFMPYCMDIRTLEEHITWARPLSPGDTRNLKRLVRRPELADLRAVIAHILLRGVKLEQEAVFTNSSRQKETGPEPGK